jgi:hypothetical protein
MAQTTTLHVTGPLTDEERALLAIRDRCRVNFQAAITEEGRRYWLRKVEEVVERYDELRTGKWERGEVS